MKEVERIWTENRDLTDKAQEALTPLPSHGHAPATELKFSCPHCHQHIACDAPLAGTPIKCPGCQAELMVPKSSAQQIAERLGMTLSNPDDVEAVRRVLLSTDAAKIVLRNPAPEEDLETAIVMLLPICAISGALLGVWTANQPGVSLLRDKFGREVWSSHSVLGHICGGAYLGLVASFILYYLSVPVRWSLQQLAGKSRQDKLVELGLGLGRYLGMGVGGLIGAIGAIGSNGTLLRGRYVDGFFWGNCGERGFLFGGFLVGLGVGLALVVIGKLRFQFRRPDTATNTSIRQH